MIYINFYKRMYLLVGCIKKVYTVRTVKKSIYNGGSKFLFYLYVLSMCPHILDYRISHVIL